MSSIYAHYDPKNGVKELLKDHLRTAASECIDSIPPTIRFDSIRVDQIKELSYGIAALHDLGKYTPYFQDYLVHGLESPLKTHAHISACYAHSFILDRMKRWEDPEGISRVLSFFAYLVIRYHHGDLKVENDFPPGKKGQEELSQQSARIKEKGKLIEEELQSFLRMTDEEINRYGDLTPFFKDRTIHLMPSLLQVKWKSERWYFLLLYLFSLLIDRDKLSSSGITKREIHKVPPSSIQTYLEQKGKISQSQMGKMREEARNTILHTLEQIDDDTFRQERIYTLTAPTGIGKTLASLQAALAMQERVARLEGYTPRIITAIPFINIIEQNKDVYKEVLTDLEIMVQHRYADLNATGAGKSEEGLPLYQKNLLVESWEGDVILTTFVQFWQSLFTGKNRLVKKVNKLAGSIVILDEVQSIPEIYLPLIGAMIQKIGDYYGTRFILMTATQPKIIEFGNALLNMKDDPKGKRAIELLPDHEKYFRNMKRTKLVPKLDEPFTTKSFLSWFLTVWDGRSSVVIVVNTIRRSIELFENLKKMKESGEIDPEVQLYYLSTNIIPKQRREVIKEIEKNLEKGRLILVSTQTIEAGVDLDFDMGIRDLAPLDSIIQTAGRVNREGKKGEYFPVYLITLEKDHQRIYPFHRLSLTKELLSFYQEVLEPEYRAMMERYFTILQEMGVPDESKDLWDAVKRLDFEEVEKFRLIEDSGTIADVYVESDGDPYATKLLDAYTKWRRKDADLGILREVLGLQDQDLDHPFIQSKITRLLLAKMGEYMIQVRVERLLKNRPPHFSDRDGVEADFFWIPAGQNQFYYDAEIGFKDESGNGYIC